MSDKTLVSVYITNYNYCDYITKSIESVLNQTFQDFELIIIDDGSTDKSKEILREYAEHKKIKVIFQENKGLIPSINTAIKACSGKLIMRLDADDYLDENALLVMVNKMNNNKKLAMVFPDYFYVDKEGNIIGQERRLDFQNEVTVADRPAHGACSLIRKDILLEVGLYNSNFSCQDGYDIWLKLLDNYPVDNINLPLFYYRRHGKNLTEDNERLLKTRAQIYATHVKNKKKSIPKTIAIIPIRGQSFDPNCMALEKIQDESLLAITINNLLKTDLINDIIVTSRDPDIIKHVTDQFNNNVKCIQRDVEDSFINILYDQAIYNAYIDYPNKNIDAVFIATVNNPLLDSFYIDKAINYMATFDVDSVIGVNPVSENYFFHNGQSLEPITKLSDSPLKLEKDYFYRQGGGFKLLKKELITKNGINKGRMGHIVLSKKASLSVNDLTDLEIAKALFQKRK